MEAFPRPNDRNTQAPLPPKVSPESLRYSVLAQGEALVLGG